MYFFLHCQQQVTGAGVWRSCEEAWYRKTLPPESQDLPYFTFSSSNGGGSSVGSGGSSGSCSSAPVSSGSES